jgi:AcrR family transcriptional regulator
VDLKKDAMERIVMTACSLFDKKGFDAVTMEDIGKRRKVSAESIALFFANTEEIFNYLIESVYHQIIDIMKGFVKNELSRRLRAGDVEIAADRLRFSSEELAMEFIERFSDYHAALLEYLTGRRVVLRLILSESLRKGKRRGCMRRFLALCEPSPENPIFEGEDALLERLTLPGAFKTILFLFQFAPLIDYAVYYEDCQTLFGPSDASYRAIIDTMKALGTRLIDGRDIRFIIN